MCKALGWVGVGKQLGRHACIGRVAQGQRGGGMRVLGVFEIGLEGVYLI